MVTAPAASKASALGLAAATAAAGADAYRAAARATARAPRGKGARGAYGEEEEGGECLTGGGDGGDGDGEDKGLGMVWGHASRSGKLAALALILPIWRAQVGLTPAWPTALELALCRLGVRVVP